MKLLNMTIAENGKEHQLFVLKDLITKRLFSFSLDIKMRLKWKQQNISDGLIFICFGQLWVS